MSNKRDLSQLERSILEIATNLRKRKKFFNFDELFKTAASLLSDSNEEILNSINFLYQSGYLIEGARVTADTVLKNEKRNQIYDYTKENPGAHIREIQRIFNLGSGMAFRHLKYLEKFGLIKNKRFMNKKAYFSSDFDETKIEEKLVLKNERAKQILDLINLHKRVRLSDLEKFLNLSHGQIQPSIKSLLDYDLINSINENNIVYYIPKISEPTVPYKSIEPITPDQTVKVIAAETTVSTEPITIKREFDYVGGNIRFKIAVQNNTNMSVSNISVNLNPSEQFFWNETIQKIPTLAPLNSRGVDFTLIPNCCGKSTVFGAVSYQDAFGNPHTLTIAPKEIAIKCPLVIPQKMSQFEVNELIKSLKKSAAKISYGNVSSRQAFDIALNHLEALDLSKVTVNSEEFSALYSGQVKVTGQQIVTKLYIDQPYIIIEVWANDLTQTTGFLAYIRNLISISLEDSLKTLEKSEDHYKKITQNFNSFNELKDCFEKCGNNEKIKIILSNITKIKNSLGQFYPNSKILSSMDKWILKFKGIYEEENCIDAETAIQLEYDLIDWLKQIQEWTSLDISTFKENFKNVDTYTQEFKIGQENIRKNLEILDKLYALSIINYIIIILKKNGLAIYQEKIGAINLDADLISGFLTAIQNFGTEISKKESSMTGLKYENYNIEVETGDYIQAVLLLSGRANGYLAESLLNFVKEFEKNYEVGLKSFVGNVSQFNEAKEIFQRNFKLSI